MTLRPRRFVITCCFALGSLVPWNATADPTPPQGAVWKVKVLEDGSARFESPTTYVVAARHAVEGNALHAYDATIFASTWSMNVGELTIDRTVDAVKITVLRTDAPAAAPREQE